MFEPAKIIEQFAEGEDLDLNFNVRKLATRLSRANSEEQRQAHVRWEEIHQLRLDNKLQEIQTLLTRQALNQTVDNESNFCWWQQALLKLLRYVPGA